MTKVDVYDAAAVIFITNTVYYSKISGDFTICLMMYSSHEAGLVQYG